ncbi:MAG: lipopolysaccharide kinase InaA family protein, partial [Vicinamibacterales bacterium]
MSPSTTTAVKRQAPSTLVATFDPPEASVIKREERTLIWREVRPGGDHVVVKLYRKRSAGSALRSRIMRFRTEREYRRLRHLQRWGIPCTEPLGWGAGWSREHGFHEVLLMREVPNALPLRDHLKAALDGQGKPGLASVPLDPLFRIVRRMHESGFCNQTLYARNVLVNRD